MYNVYTICVCVCMCVCSAERYILRYRTRHVMYFSSIYLFLISTTIYLFLISTTIYLSMQSKNLPPPPFVVAVYAPPARSFLTDLEGLKYSSFIQNLYPRYDD